MDKPNHLEVGARVPSVNFRTRKGDEWVDLQTLDLSERRLRDSIPESIGELRKLTVLNLNGNTFIGKIPESIANSMHGKLIINSVVILFCQNRMFWTKPIDVWY